MPRQIDINDSFYQSLLNNANSGHKDKIKNLFLRRLFNSRIPSVIVDVLANKKNFNNKLSLANQRIIAAYAATDPAFYSYIEKQYPNAYESWLFSNNSLIENYRKLGVTDENMAKFILKAPARSGLMQEVKNLENPVKNISSNFFGKILNMIFGIGVAIKSRLPMELTTQLNKKIEDLENNLEVILEKIPSANILNDDLHTSQIINYTSTNGDTLKIEKIQPKSDQSNSKKSLSEKIESLKELEKSINSGHFDPIEPANRFNSLDDTEDSSFILSNSSSKIHDHTLFEDEINSSEDNFQQVNATLYEESEINFNGNVSLSFGTVNNKSEQMDCTLYEDENSVEINKKDVTLYEDESNKSGTNIMDGTLYTSDCETTPSEINQLNENLNSKDSFGSINSSTPKTKNITSGSVTTSKQSMFAHNNSCDKNVSVTQTENVDHSKSNIKLS